MDILKARKMYEIEKIRPSKELAKASKCSLKGLKQIFRKGQGAYFSSVVDPIKRLIPGDMLEWLVQLLEARHLLLILK